MKPYQTSLKSLHCAAKTAKDADVAEKDESQVSLTDLSGEWAIELVNGKK